MPHIYKYITLNLVQTRVNESLERRSKYLAQRARIQCTEKGEKSNKYFLNLIKTQNTKQEINSLIIDNTETNDRESFKTHQVMWGRVGELRRMWRTASVFMGCGAEVKLSAREYMECLALYNNPPTDYFSKSPTIPP